MIQDRIWHSPYADFLFNKVVPLYHKAGTKLFGSPFSIGDPVYLTEQNSIGFVINGPTNEKEWEDWRNEVRTETDGVQSFQSLVPLNASHLEIAEVQNPYRDEPEVMQFFQNLAPPEIKLVIVRFAEKENWHESIQKKFTQIWGYYLVDLSQPFHQCSMQLDVQAYFLYNRFDWPEEQDFPFDEDERSWMECNDGDQSHPTFALHTNWGKCIVRDCADYCPEEDTWEEYIGSEIETLRCNPIDFEYCQNLTTLS